MLAGAVNLDNVAVAAKNNSNIIRIQSEGYPAFEVDLTSLKPDKKEQFTSAALVQGYMCTDERTRIYHWRIRCLY